MIPAPPRDRRVIVCPLCHKALPITAGEDENEVWERHTAAGLCQEAPKAQRCPAKGCREKLTVLNTCVCGSCGEKVCLRHRFEDAHDCRSLRPKQAAPGASAKGAASEAVIAAQSCRLAAAKGGSKLSRLLTQTRIRRAVA